MRSRTNEVSSESRPELFNHPDFKGQVYALDEPVFDTLSVVRALAEPRMKSICAIKKDSFNYHNNTACVETKAGSRLEFKTGKLVLMAGQGNGALLKALDQKTPTMQRRPLKMVMVRGGLQEMIYAHCMGTSVNPRVTITSHRDGQNEIVWYLGGQRAEDGVSRTDAEQINVARTELSELIPWQDLSQSQWAAISIDRAEVKVEGQKRPDTFFADIDEAVITAWPTKMALSPVLAEHVVEMINKADINRVGDKSLPAWPDVEYAEFPWCENVRWQS